MTPKITRLVEQMLKGENVSLSRVISLLKVPMGGRGRVDYYGQPRVTKKIAPLGAVTHLIDVEEVAAR